MPESISKVQESGETTSFEYLMGRISFLSYGLGIISILLTSLVFPLFSDEVTYRAILSRYFYDGRSFVYFFPECWTEGLSAPILWAPGLFFQALVFGKIETPFQFRIVGFLISATVFSVFVFLSRNTSRNSLVNLFPFLLSIGLVPISFILLRPELLLSLALVLSLTIYFSFQGRSTIAVSTLLLIALSSFTVHPKALFLTPFFLSLIYCVGQSPLPRFVATLGVLLGAYQSVVFYHLVLGCLKVRQMTGTLNLAFRFTETDWSSLAQSVLQNIIGTLLPFQFQFFRASSDNPYYIFPVDLPFPLLYLGNVVLLFVWVSLTTLFVVRFREKIASLFVGSPPSNRKELIILANLGIGIILQQCFQTYRNFYDASYLVTAFVCGAFLLFRGSSVSLTTSFRRMLFVLSVSIVFLQGLFLLVVVPQLLPSLNGQLLPGLVSRHFVTTFQPSDRGSQVRKVAQDCGLLKSDKNYLIVDAETFFPLSKSLSLPIFIEYTGFGQYLGEGGEAELEAYRARDTLVRCELLNEKALREASHIGRYCCLKRSETLVTTPRE